MPLTLGGATDEPSLVPSPAEHLPQAASEAQWDLKPGLSNRASLLWTATLSMQLRPVRLASGSTAKGPWEENLSSFFLQCFMSSNCLMDMEKKVGFKVPWGVFGTQDQTHYVALARQTFALLS